MLDIKFIRTHKKEVANAAKVKNMQVDLDKLLKLDDEKRDLQTKIETLRAKRSQIADEISTIIHKKEHNKDKIETLKNEAQSVKNMLKDLEPQLVEVSEALFELSLTVPNIPAKDAPIGPDESGNKVIASYGEKPKFNFKIKDHLTLGQELDLFDLDRGTKVSGFRGYYLKNELAVLHMAVLQFAFEKMLAKGFTPMIVPTLVHKEALTGSGHFPFGKEEIYQIANPGKLSDGAKITEPLYLVGTAEPSLLAYRMNEMLDEKELPLKYFGFSACYRSEVGSYGKDTKGLYRLHEFAKIEQVVICEADHKIADKYFQELRQNSEDILQALKLPYQVLEICTGDMGAGKYKMYDIETWMPARQKYCETHSNSHLTDWQTRRLNIRYKTKDGKKVFAYALNNTALASPRILIAILENYQTADGNINIPSELWKYTGFKQIIKK